MFGIGMPELILILAVALIVIGPKKLPDLAQSLGKALNEFKKATQDFKDSMDSEMKDFKKPLDDVTRDVNRIEDRKKSRTENSYRPPSPEEQAVKPDIRQPSDQPETVSEQPQEPKSDENDRSNG